MPCAEWYTSVDSRLRGLRRLCEHHRHGTAVRGRPPPQVPDDVQGVPTAVSLLVFAGLAELAGLLRRPLHVLVNLRVGERHGGPIRRRKRGCILTTDQSDAASA
eukprot:1182072-Prorocentrum_minimum.AAC.1